MMNVSFARSAGSNLNLPLPGAYAPGSTLAPASQADKFRGDGELETAITWCIISSLGFNLTREQVGQTDRKLAGSRGQ